MAPELEERAEACGAPIHRFPLPLDYLTATHIADVRIRGGWTNAACEGCGVFGWLPPSAAIIEPVDVRELVKVERDLIAAYCEREAARHQKLEDADDPERSSAAWNQGAASAYRSTATLLRSGVEL